MEKKVYLFIVSIVFSLIGLAQTPVSGLISEWNYKNETKTNTVTGKDYIVSSAANVYSTVDRFGNNNAIYVKKGAYIDYAHFLDTLYDDAMTGIDAAFTISFWVNPKNLYIYDQVLIAKTGFEKCGTYSQGWAILVDGSTRKISMMMHGIDQGFGSRKIESYVRVNGNTPINNNAWTHIAISVDMNSFRANVAQFNGFTMYVNGVKQSMTVQKTSGSGISATGILNADAHLSMGTYLLTGETCSGNHDYEGVYDDFRIYDTTLTDSSLMALYEEEVCNAPKIVEENGSLKVSGGPYTSVVWYEEGDSISNESSILEPVFGASYSVTVQDSLCTTSSPEFTYLITGTSSSNIEYLSFLPNPAHDQLVLSQSCEWEVLSIRGESLLKGSGANVDLTQISQGVYVLVLQSDESRSTQKFVKN